jgi:hypothetical protein
MAGRVPLSPPGSVALAGHSSHQPDPCVPQGTCTGCALRCPAKIAHDPDHVDRAVQAVEDVLLMIDVVDRQGPVVEALLARPLLDPLDGLRNLNIGLLESRFISHHS